MLGPNWLSDCFGTPHLKNKPLTGFDSAGQSVPCRLGHFFIAVMNAVSRNTDFRLKDSSPFLCGERPGMYSKHLLEFTIRNQYIVQ